MLPCKLLPKSKFACMEAGKRQVCVQSKEGIFHFLCMCARKQQREVAWQYVYMENYQMPCPPWSTASTVFQQVSFESASAGLPAEGEEIIIEETPGKMECMRVSTPATPGLYYYRAQNIFLLREVPKQSQYAFFIHAYLVLLHRTREMRQQHKEIYGRLSFMLLYSMPSSSSYHETHVTKEKASHILSFLQSFSRAYEKGRVELLEYIYNVKMDSYNIGEEEPFFVCFPSSFRLIHIYEPFLWAAATLPESSPAAEGTVNRRGHTWMKKWRETQHLYAMKYTTKMLFCNISLFQRELFSTEEDAWNYVVPSYNEIPGVPHRVWRGTKRHNNSLLSLWLLYGRLLLCWFAGERSASFRASEEGYCHFLPVLSPIFSFSFLLFTVPVLSPPSFFFLPHHTRIHITWRLYSCCHYT